MRPGWNLDSDRRAHGLVEGFFRLDDDGLAIDPAGDQHVIADQFAGIDRPAETISKAAKLGICRVSILI